MVVLRVVGEVVASVVVVVVLGIAFMVAVRDLAVVTLGVEEVIVVTLFVVNFEFAVSVKIQIILKEYLAVEKRLYDLSANKLKLTSL